jgi:hypothetical protein
MIPSTICASHFGKHYSIISSAASKNAVPQPLIIQVKYKAGSYSDNTLDVYLGDTQLKS